MGHFEGRELQESYVHDDGTRWGSADRKIRLDEKTWAPVKNLAIPQLPGAPLAPAISETLEISETDKRAIRKAELEAMDYHRIRSDFKIKSERGLTKEKLIEAILDQEGL